MSFELDDNCEVFRSGEHVRIVSGDNAGRCAVVLGKLSMTNWLRVLSRKITPKSLASFRERWSGIYSVYFPDGEYTVVPRDELVRTTTQEICNALRDTNRSSAPGDQ